MTGGRDVPQQSLWRQLEEFETSQQLKYQNFQSISIQIEENVVYFLRWRLSWHTLNRNCIFVKKHYLAVYSFPKFKMLNQKIQETVSQHVWTWTPVISARTFNFQHISLGNLDMRRSSEQNWKSSFQSLRFIVLHVFKLLLSYFNNGLCTSQLSDIIKSLNCCHICICLEGNMSYLMHVFLAYLHTTVIMPSSSGSLIIAIKPQER